MSELFSVRSNLKIISDPIGEATIPNKNPLFRIWKAYGINKNKTELVATEEGSDTIIMYSVLITEMEI